MRVAGGQVWEDSSLADWETDDFRIFCGDLGNDVNDELLTRTFNKFPSFMRAKVIRDKRTGKSKGFGFVSFKEPQDFIRAMKEMDGKITLLYIFIYSPNMPSLFFIGLNLNLNEHNLIILINNMFVPRCIG